VSNQMFYPQENEPESTEERQSNSDLREQYTDYQTPPQPDYAREASYERGYCGYAANMGGEKLRRFRPGRENRSGYDKQSLRRQ